MTKPRCTSVASGWWQVEMLSPVRLASFDNVVSPPSSAMVSSKVSARSTDWMLAPAEARPWRHCGHNCPILQG